MQGIVYKSTGSWYKVRSAQGVFYACRVKGRLRIAGIKSTNPVAVGDKVSFILEHTGDETIGVIKEVHPRKNYIVRKSVNLSKQTHILAANIDLAFLVVTLAQPVTPLAFVDRFLATAEAYDIPVVILFNKTDCYTSDLKQVLESYLQLYRQVGYKCVPMSVHTAEGIDTVKTLMHKKVSVFSGNSGVGKSSIINTLAPTLNLKTKPISETHNQGQHTTTFAQMYDLPFEAQIIDTPGIRGFGVVAMQAEEVGDYFPEIFSKKQDCKFYNCLHLEEPHCAVKLAVKDGQIAQSRYDNYVQIVKGDQDETFRKTNYN